MNNPIPLSAGSNPEYGEGDIGHPYDDSRGQISCWPWKGSRHVVGKGPGQGPAEQPPAAASRKAGPQSHSRSKPKAAHRL